MLSAVHWGPLPHGRVYARRIIFCLHFQVVAPTKKAPESCDPGAPVENGFKPRSFLPAAAFYLQVSALKNTDKLVDFSALLLRTRLFCRNLVPYQAPPFSDGGLFSSTLGVKRQAPPLPCFVLDKKLTIRVAIGAASLAAGLAASGAWKAGKSWLVRCCLGNRLCKRVHAGRFLRAQPPWAILRLLQAGRIV